MQHGWQKVADAVGPDRGGRDFDGRLPIGRRLFEAASGVGLSGGPLPIGASGNTYLLAVGQLDQRFKDQAGGIRSAAGVFADDDDLVVPSLQMRLQWNELD